MDNSATIVTFLYSFFSINSLLFGIVIGSFLNVVIYRVPEKRTIVKGHSMCMTCGHTLGAKDLVPLFSWLFLKGKCRYCGAPVASRYAKIESFTGIVFLITALTHLECSFIVVLPNIFYIVLAIQYVLFLAAVCVGISAMMIYHDTNKGFWGLALISVISGFISLILKELNLSTTVYNLLLKVALPVSLVFISTFIIKLFFSLFKNSYTKNDFLADLTIMGLLLHEDYSVIFPNVYSVPVTIIEILAFSIIYGLIRATLKKTKKEKLSVIIGFVLIVILIIIRYSIMTLVYKF